MGQLYRPSLSEILAVAHSKGEFSDAPDLWDGLVGAWTFQEGGGDTIFDVSGHSNHGTQAQSDQKTKWTTSNRGRSLDFDGSNDYVDTNESQSLRDLPETHNFTVSFWFNSTSAAIDEAALAWNGTDDLVFYPNDSSSGSGGARVFWRDVGNNIINESGPDLSGEWHSFTFVSRAADDHEAYRDGVSVGTSSATGTAGPFSNILIGTFEPVNQAFDGLIDDVRIYDRALSANEIQELYADPWGAYRVRKKKYYITSTSLNRAVGTAKQEPLPPSYEDGYAHNRDESEYPHLWDGLVGLWLPGMRGSHATDGVKDFSGKGNHGTTNGSMTASDWVARKRPTGEVGHALDFDGSDDYVDLGDISDAEGNGSYTFSAWVLVRDDTKDNDILVKGNHLSNEPFIWWFDSAATDHWNILITDGGGSTTGALSSAHVPVIDTWYHVVVVLEQASQIRMFIDGEEDANSPFNTPTIDGIDANAANDRIGTNSNVNIQTMDGLIDDVRIYDRALSASEIKQIYLGASRSRGFSLSS